MPAFLFVITVSDSHTFLTGLTFRTVIKFRTVTKYRVAVVTVRIVERCLAR